MPIDAGGEGGEGGEGGGGGGGEGEGGGGEGDGGGGEGGGGGRCAGRCAVPSSSELLHEISSTGDSELLVLELRSLSKAVVRTYSLRYLVSIPHQLQQPEQGRGAHLQPTLPS